MEAVGCCVDGNHMSVAGQLPVPTTEQGSQARLRHPRSSSPSAGAEGSTSPAGSERRNRSEEGKLLQGR